MQQTIDFGNECRELERLLMSLEPADWHRTTLFKNWTVDDMCWVHLHFWNKAADLSLNDPEAFQLWIRKVLAEISSTGFRATENARIRERGVDLLEEWRQGYSSITEHWSGLDPKRRVSWAGPDMSVRSSITARQMETWAHGQAVFDLFAEPRRESGRIKNIAVLGINTFGWSYQVRKLDTQAITPAVNLISPSGKNWALGEDSNNTVSGSAVEFCQIVTQTRHLKDTSILTQGEVAKNWMCIAQCFAGAAHEPPAPGSRFANSNRPVSSSGMM